MLTSLGVDKLQGMATFFMIKKSFLADLQALYISRDTKDWMKEIKKALYVML
jgi:hypothetical protein